MNELGIGVSFALIDRFSSNSQKIRNEFGQLSGTTDALSNRINNSINKIQTGFKLMAVGASLAAPFLLSSNAANNYQSKLAELSAITGVTGSDLDKLGERAQSLALKFGVDVGGSIESFKLILSRLGPEIGQNGKALQAMGENAAILSKSMGGDVKASIEALTTAMLQYNVDLSNPIRASGEMAKIMNVMAASAKVGSAEVPQIAATLQNAGLEARNAGLSFEEFNAVTQTLGLGSLYGAEAGTKLRNILIKLGEGRFLPKDTAQALKSAGVDVNMLGNSSLSLADRLQHLKKIQKDSALVSHLFGSENSSAAKLLLENVDKIRKWTNEVTGTTEAMTQAEIIMKTNKEALARLGAAWEVLQINLGTVLNPILTVLYDKLTSVFGAMSRFLNSPTGQILAQATLYVSAFALAFGGLIVALNTARFLSLQASLAFMSLGQTSIATAFATKGLAGGLKVLAFEAAKGLLALWPYIAVGAAVGGAVYFMYQSFKEFGKFMNGVQKPASGLLGFMQKLGGVISSVISIFNTWDGKSFNLGGMEAGLKSLGILDFVLNLGTWVVRLIELGKAFSQTFVQIFTFLGGVVNSVFTYISTQFNKFADTLGFSSTLLAKNKDSLASWQLAGKILAGFVVGVLVVAFGYLATTVIAATWPFLAVGAIVGGLIYLFMNWRGVLDFAGKAFRAMGEYIWGTILWLGQGIYNFITSIPAFFIWAFQGIGNAIAAYYTQFVPWFFGKIGEFGSGVLRFFSNLGTKIVDYLKTSIIEAWSGLKEWFSNAMTDLVNIGNYFTGETNVNVKGSPALVPAAVGGGGLFDMGMNKGRPGNFDEIARNQGKYNASLATYKPSITIPSIEQPPVIVHSNLMLDGETIAKSVEASNTVKNSRK
jgi:TP901 family phage tail tape measure protein